jgi:hypothetical protein
MLVYQRINDELKKRKDNQSSEYDDLRAEDIEKNFVNQIIPTETPKKMLRRKTSSKWPISELEIPSFFNDKKNEIKKIDSEKPLKCLYGNY